MSSYIRFEMLLFLRSLEMGAMMLLAYRAICLPGKLIFRGGRWKNTMDILYWICTGILLFVVLYRYNYGRLRLFMLPGIAAGGVFVDFVLKRLLFLVKRCKISSYKPTKRRLCGNRRSRRFEKVKKEEK